jgi:probable HAF family extracellular repeat protein
MRTRGALLLLAMLNLAAPQPAAFQASFYSLIDVGTLGGRRSVALGVDRLGRVVGYSQTAGEQLHAFVYIEGRLFDLGTFGGADSYAYRISDRGVVVGRAQTASGLYRPFVTVLHGQLFDLSSLDRRLAGPFSSVMAVNNSDRVVGYYQTPGHHMAARNRIFLYEGGTIVDLGAYGGEDGIVAAVNDSGQMTGSYGTDPDADYSDRNGFLVSGATALTLPTLGGRVTMPTDLNNLAQVVGYAQTAGGERRAFLYSNGTMRDLGTLAGGSQSFAYAINDSGHVVGSSSSSDGGLRAFVYAGGRMQDLNSLVAPDWGWLLTEARDINDAGQIVGTGVINGQQHAFLLSPIG